MKKLLIVLVTIGLALGASAQRGHVRGGGGYFHGPRVIVGIGGGYSPFYPFYRPYSPWSYPYGYNYRPRPSRLDLQVQDIQTDYADRIKSVRMDNTLKRRERKKIIRQLRYDRDKAVIQAKRDYYYNRSGNAAP